MADSTMYRASQDCIAFVEQIGVKLRNVVPEYMTKVKGDIGTSDLPQAREARIWINTFLEINARFNGRILTNGRSKKNPKGRDLRITVDEIQAIASLAQWLINLDAERLARVNGLPPRGTQLTVKVDDMIVRERIIA